MSVKDNFAKLKEQAEKADRTVKAAEEQNQAEIKAKVDEARRDADARAAELRAKTDEAAREGESNWREMQADLNRHIERADNTARIVDVNLQLLLDFRNVLVRERLVRVERSHSLRMVRVRRGLRARA